MAWLWSIISFFNNLWSAWKQIQEAKAAASRAEAERRRQELEKAIEDQKNAKTEDEFDEAQDRIIDNSN